MVTRTSGVSLTTGVTTDYVNTIPVAEQPAYPGDHAIERRICSAVRWNAIAMVLRSQKKDSDLGGHILPFQSAATMYEVCYANPLLQSCNREKRWRLNFLPRPCSTRYVCAHS